MTTLTIYVPMAGNDLGVKEGSAMVGTDFGQDRITIDYEGNLYGALNAVLFKDKLTIAAGRHVERYPTIARMFVHTGQVLAVGSYNTETRRIYIDNAEALESWIGEEAFSLLTQSDGDYDASTRGVVV